MEKLVLIDTFNFLHRAYHALPNTLTDANGEPTNAVYGVTSMLISTFDQLKPDYVLAALDDIEPTFRVEEFTAYKAHRKPMEDDLASQIPKVFEIIDAFGIAKLSLPGYEADDIIGTMVETHAGDNLEIIIVSNDHDLWQLVDGNIMVMNPQTKGPAEWVGHKEVVARYGFDPEQIIDYKGLRGDASDNIPGVYGIGDVTATKLIKEYKNIEGIYGHLDEIEPKSLRKKLEENYEQALMSKKLATIIRDAPMQIALKDCKYSTFNKGRVKETLEKYRFKSLIKRLGFEVSGSKSKKKQEVPDNQLSLL
jgi:DNA polymerase-1